MAWQAGKGNPVALFGSYVPRSFRFGRPLFDDVDTERRWTALADRIVGTARVEA